MTLRHTALFATLVTAGLPGVALAQPLHRFALFVGNNEGGEGTRALLYAHDDAKRLFDVFQRVGGVHGEDAMLLLDSRADDVLTALGELERRSRDAHARGERTVLFFYYSGHAQDGALRLGSSKLPLESIKSRLAAGPADVRVAVFDACRSGAMTRTKGVRRAPAFEVETDATRAARGLVILTSSASDEDSQESDLIGASYFSYHLATGLIGSADQSGDGRVSLSEAYAWAYERTVASTADSAAGPQHPTFSFDLAGNGDLVLTDVIERKEGLWIPAEAPRGTYFVIDARGVVVAEAVKTDQERVIALSPGNYVIKRRLTDHLRIGEARVQAGHLSIVDEPAFKNARFSDDPVKGTGIATKYAAHWGLSASGNFHAIFDARIPSSVLVGGELVAHNFFGRGFGFSIDANYGWTTSSTTTPLLGTITWQYSIATGGGSLLYELNQTNTLVPFGGINLAFVYMRRAFDDPTYPAQDAYAFAPGVLLGLKLRLTRNFSLVARARAHFLTFKIDKAQLNAATADFGATLDYEFSE